MLITGHCALSWKYDNIRCDEDVRVGAGRGAWRRPRGLGKRAQREGARCEMLSFLRRSREASCVQLRTVRSVTQLPAQFSRICHEQFRIVQIAHEI